MSRKEEKRRRVIERAREILEAKHPMHFQQLYEQLIAEGLILHHLNHLRSLETALDEADRSGIIPSDWVAYPRRMQKVRELRLSA